MRKASAACHSNVQHVPVGDRVARDLDEAIDWQWLHRAYTAAGSASFSSCTLWAGHGGGCTPSGMWSSVLATLFGGDRMRVVSYRVSPSSADGTR